MQIPDITWHDIIWHWAMWQVQFGSALRHSILTLIKTHRMWWFNKARIVVVILGARIVPNTPRLLTRGKDVIQFDLISRTAAMCFSMFFQKPFLCRLPRLSSCSAWTRQSSFKVWYQFRAKQTWTIDDDERKTGNTVEGLPINGQKERIETLGGRVEFANKQE